MYWMRKREALRLPTGNLRKTAMEVLGFLQGFRAGAVIMGSVRGWDNNMEKIGELSTLTGNIVDEVRSVGDLEGDVPRLTLPGPQYHHMSQYLHSFYAS